MDCFATFLLAVFLTWSPPPLLAGACLTRCHKAIENLTWNLVNNPYQNKTNSWLKIWISLKSQYQSNAEYCSKCICRKTLYSYNMKNLRSRSFTLPHPPVMDEWALGRGRKATKLTMGRRTDWPTNIASFREACLRLKIKKTRSIVNEMYVKLFSFSVTVHKTGWAWAVVSAEREFNDPTMTLISNIFRQCHVPLKKKKRKFLKMQTRICKRLHLSACQSNSHTIGSTHKCSNSQSQFRMGGGAETSLTCRKNWFFFLFTQIHVR